MANLGSKTLITQRNATDRFLVTQSGDTESKEALPNLLLGIPVVRTLTDSDTLLATDAFKKVVFNISSGKTCTVNAGIFSEGDIVYVERQGAGELTFVEGTATITTSLGALTDAGANQLMVLIFTADDACNLYNGSPSTSVPTSRTLAGLDLSANRSASELMAALGVPPYLTGRLYGPSDYTALTTATLTINVLRFAPFWVKRALPISALNFEVTTNASVNVRSGIYADNGNFYPGDLIHGSEEFDAAVGAGAAPSMKSSSISTTLTPGLYWVGCISSGSVVLRAANTVGQQTWGGFSATALATILPFYYTVAQTYGALPSTFPGGATVNATGTQPPFVGVVAA